MRTWRIAATAIGFAIGYLIAFRIMSTGSTGSVTEETINGIFIAPVPDTPIDHIVSFFMGVVSSAASTVITSKWSRIRKSVGNLAYGLRTVLKGRTLKTKRAT